LTFAATILSTKMLKRGLTDKATAYGLDIIERSFIQTTAIPFSYSEKEPAACFVFTSSNAVKSVLASGISFQSKKMASTSGETRKLLNENNITVDFEGHDAKSLADKLIEAKVTSVVFFCGNIHRDELPEKLKASNIKVEEIIVYETTLTPAALNEPFDAILFFSPSAVDSFLINNRVADNTICFCIGHTTSNHLASKTKATIHIAATPSQEKLIDQLINYYTHQVHVEK